MELKKHILAMGVAAVMLLGTAFVATPTADAAGKTHHAVVHHSKTGHKHKHKHQRKHQSTTALSVTKASHKTHHSKGTHSKHKGHKSHGHKKKS